MNFWEKNKLIWNLERKKLLWTFERKKLLWTFQRKQLLWTFERKKTLMNFWEKKNLYEILREKKNFYELLRKNIAEHFWFGLTWIRYLIKWDTLKKIKQKLCNYYFCATFYFSTFFSLFFQLFYVSELSFSEYRFFLFLVLTKKPKTNIFLTLFIRRFLTKFHFFSNFSILGKISIFNLNLDFQPKFSMSNQKFRFLIQLLIFWPKLYFLTKISLSDLNFICWPKFGFSI